MTVLKKIRSSLKKRVLKNVALGLTTATVLGHSFEGFASQTTLNGEGTSSQTELSLAGENPEIIQQNQSQFLSDLPNDMLSHMISFLDREDLLVFRLASKKACFAVTDALLLKNHPHAEFTLQLDSAGITHSLQDYMGAFPHSVSPLPIAHLEFVGNNLEEWERLSSLFMEKKYTPSMSYATFLRGLAFGLLSCHEISLSSAGLPSRFPNLQQLTLRGFSQVTSINELLNLPHLEELNITEGSNLTEEVVREQLPNLQRFNVITLPRIGTDLQGLFDNQRVSFDDEPDFSNEFPTLQDMLISGVRGVKRKLGEVKRTLLSPFQNLRLSHSRGSAE